MSDVAGWYCWLRQRMECPQAWPITPHPLPSPTRRRKLRRLHTEVPNAEGNGMKELSPWILTPSSSALNDNRAVFLPLCSERVFEDWRCNRS
ncbi:hypothetical protein FKM82_009962 [Ascaphus truei]